LVENQLVCSEFMMAVPFCVLNSTFRSGFSAFAFILALPRL
jgi:hypothetical protein